MSHGLGKFRFYLRTKLPYVHIFMYITVACTFVLMISTIVLYVIFSRTMVSEYGNQSASMLRKDAESMEFLLDWTLSYALQTRNDPVILPFVQWNYENDYLNYEVWRRLQNLMDNHPLISSIYLINGYNGNVLDTRAGFGGYGLAGFQRGARIVRLQEDSDRFETWIRLENGARLAPQREHAPELTRSKAHEAFRPT